MRARLKCDMDRLNFSRFGWLNFSHYSSHSKGSVNGMNHTSLTLPTRQTSTAPLQVVLSLEKQRCGVSAMVRLPNLLNVT